MRSGIDISEGGLIERGYPFWLRREGLMRDGHDRKGGLNRTLTVCSPFYLSLMLISFIAFSVEMIL